MENRYNNLIEEFEANFRKLLAERNELKKRNASLQDELTRKQEELMKAHKDILDLRNEYTLLQTADGLSGSVVNRENSRKRLEKIVQEIDRCLMLLNG